MKLRKPRRNTLQMNFERLSKLKIIQDGHVIEGRYVADGYMDLVVEVIPTPIDIPKHLKSGNCVAVSLVHYFKQNGDLCKDPEQVIVVNFDNKYVEALTFEMSIPPRHYKSYEGADRYYPQIKKENNSFLKNWLVNLANQGHKLPPAAA